MSFDALRVLVLQNANDLRAELQKIGADLSTRFDGKHGETHLIKIEHITAKLARFLYQEMMMEGGTVILPARMDDRSTIPVDILIRGTPRQLQHLVVRLRTQNEDELNWLADELARVFESMR